MKEFNFRKIFLEWRWYILSLFLILLLSFAIRIYHLTLLPVFVDEAIYVRWSQVMATEPTLRFLPLSDGKQPLYMWILMFSIKYFSDPLYIGRLISVFSGLGTLLGIFVFSYLLFKNKYVSLLSSFIYAISPFAVFFDRMALVDSMLSMFGVWTFIFTFISAKYKRLDYAMFAGFTLGFASLTKSPSVFIAVLISLIYFLFKFDGLWKIMSTYLIAFVMYNVQRLGPNFSLLSSRTSDYVFPVSHLFENPIDPLFPHLKDFYVWIFSMGPLPLIPIALLGIYFGLRSNFKKVSMLVLIVILPVLVQSEFAKAFTARYVYFVMPYFYILCGLVAIYMVRRRFRIIVFILLFLHVYQSLVFNYYLLTNPEKANLPRGERSGYLEEWTAGQGIKEISEYLRKISEKEKNSQIVVGTEGYFGTLPDGLQFYVNDLRKIVVIGVGVIISDTPQSLTESVKSGNKTYLVVNKSRFKGDPDKLGYKLIAKYPKAYRLTDSRQFYLYGPQEELLFFELTR